MRETSSILIRHKTASANVVRASSIARLPAQHEKKITVLPSTPDAMRLIENFDIYRPEKKVGCRPELPSVVLILYSAYTTTHDLMSNERTNERMNALAITRHRRIIISRNAGVCLNETTATWKNQRRCSTRPTNASWTE